MPPFQNKGRSPKTLSHGKGGQLGRQCKMAPPNWAGTTPPQPKTGLERQDDLSVSPKAKPRKISPPRPRLSLRRL
jgi:hypothetical protein